MWTRPQTSTLYIERNAMKVTMKLTGVKELIRALEKEGREIDHQTNNKQWEGFSLWKY